MNTICIKMNTICIKMNTICIKMNTTYPIKKNVFPTIGMVVNSNNGNNFKISFGICKVIRLDIMFKLFTK